MAQLYPVGIQNFESLRKDEIGMNFSKETRNIEKWIIRQKD